MKRSPLIILLISFFWVGNHVKAEKGLDQIEEELRALRTTIQEARQTYGAKAVESLKHVSLQFDKLDASEETWKAVVENHNKEKMVVDVWRKQSFKDAIGAVLFYPQEATELRHTPFKEDLLERIDRIWLFTIAAKYKDPRAQYYLSYILTNIWNQYNDDEEYNKNEVPLFYKRLAKSALAGLRANTEDVNKANPEALYILGYENATLSKELFKKHNLSKADKYLKMISDSPRATSLEKGRGKTYLYDLQSYNRGYYNAVPIPPFESYVEIAKTHQYGQALDEGSKYGRNFDRVKETLEEAAETYGYSSAYIRLGFGRKIHGKISEAREYFKKAGDQGLPYGYIQAGNAYLGADIRIKEVENLTSRFANLSESAIEEARNCYLMATQKGDLNGWEYLMALYRGLYALKKDEQYTKNFLESLEHGLDWGSTYAYDLLEELYSDVKDGKKVIKEKIQKYGRAPQKDLWKSIKRFIETK